MKVFIIIAIAALFGFGGFAASDAHAHAPTAVTLSNITETQIKITWVHLGTAGANGCGSGCGLGDAKRFVDVLRDSTNIVNNSTLQTYTDMSLAQGTEFSYTVCHGDPSTTNCTVDDDNAAKAAAVPDITVAAKPAGINLSANENNIVLTWDRSFVCGDCSTMTDSSNVFTANNTAVAGLKIEYSSDGGSSFSTSTSNSSAITNVVGAQIIGGEYKITGLESGTPYQIRVSAVTETVGTPNGAAGTAWVCPTCSISTLSPNQGTQATPPKTSAISSGDVTGGNLKVTLSEEKGWDRILSAALHTNITGDQTKEDSDTSITWHYFDGVTVVDPNNYFNEVNVVAEQSGVRTMDVTYEISWNRSLANNNAILESSDFPGNVGTTVIEDAWTSFPIKQVSHEIPDETSEETIMMLYDGGVMNHLLLNNDISYVLDDMQYFIDDSIINVSQDEKVVTQNEVNSIKQLLEKVTISHDNVKIGTNYAKTLVISGTLNNEFYQAGEHVILSITSPDGSESQISAVTTSDRNFKVPIIVDDFQSGVYQFTPGHSIHLGESFSYKH